MDDDEQFEEGDVDIGDEQESGDYSEEESYNAALAEEDQNNQAAQQAGWLENKKTELKKKVKRKIITRIMIFFLPCCLILTVAIMLTIGIFAAVVYVAEKASVPVVVDKAGNYVPQMTTSN
ncbi:MAG: hypothetical protein NTW06_02785 [Candidatus Falkowbacteria bacterium]|nr:hypothetical protein [Candidatus Falkowbacteria bacterium]